MAGFDAPYVPGWDCHGLPIEIKVDEQLGRKKLEMDPIAVRKACRDYAQKYVDLQRSQFERIGVFGRWNDPYLTMSFKYEAAIVETFYEFLQKEYVLQGPQAGLLVHSRPHRTGRGRGSSTSSIRRRASTSLCADQRSCKYRCAAHGPERRLHHHLDHDAVDHPGLAGRRLQSADGVRCPWPAKAARISLPRRCSPRSLRTVI